MPSLSRFIFLALLAAAGRALPLLKAPVEEPAGTAAGRTSPRDIDVVEAAVQGARARGVLEGMTDEEARAIARETMPLQGVQVLRNPIVDALLTVDEGSLKKAFSPVRPARRLRGLLVGVLPKIEWFLWSIPGALLLAGSALLLAGRHESVAAIAGLGEIYCWGWLTFLCAAVAATGWASGSNPWEDIPRFSWGVPFLLWITTGLLALTATRPRRTPPPSFEGGLEGRALIEDLSPPLSRRIGKTVDRLLERWLGH